MLTEEKSKLLYILKYLWLQTDDEHPAATADIVAGVFEYGVTVNRHSIPAIVAQLQEFGIDVIDTKGSPNRYFIGERNLELPEVKLLIDAVQSSRFISAKKSDELVDKLNMMVSFHQAEGLNRHLYVEGRVKADNKSLYYTVDRIHEAINNGTKIKFQYIEYTASKKKVHKHNGYVYVFSPYAVLWHNDCYYVLGYSEKHKAITKFRVDRIDKTESTELQSVKKPKGFDPVVYLKNIFSMYDGEMQNIRLKCNKDMMKVIIDRFGKDVSTVPCEDGCFMADVKISVSPTFFGWLFGFGNKICIISPQNIIDDYTAAAKKILDTYNK